MPTTESRAIMARSYASRIGDDEVQLMAELRARGWSWRSIGRRFGVTSSYAGRLVRQRGEAIRAKTGCLLPFCVEVRSHAHCRGCGISVPPARQLCELCEREAFRALLIAKGDVEEARQLRAGSSDETLLRVLELAS